MGAIWLGIRSGMECVVLERVIGSHLFKYYVKAGARGPQRAGAPGKVMLAWLPLFGSRLRQHGWTISPNKNTLLSSWKQRGAFQRCFDKPNSFWE